MKLQDIIPFRKIVVATALVRPKNGAYQFGSHIPMKAFKEDVNTKKRTTIQGGIKKGETPHEAMLRELAEECGQAFADGCTVAEFCDRPYFKLAHDGTLQECYRFWVVAPEGLDPVPNKAEIHKFFWDDYKDFKKKMCHMSEGRVELITEPTELLSPGD